MGEKIAATMFGMALTANAQRIRFISSVRLLLPESVLWFGLQKGDEGDDVPGREGTVTEERAGLLGNPWLSHSVCHKKGKQFTIRM